MNDLRIILLVLGAALVIGIYAWGIFQYRGRRTRQEMDDETRPFDLPRRRTLPNGEPGTAMDAAAADTEPSLRLRRDGPAAGQSAGIGDDGIITLYVAATAGQVFGGRAILDAMRAADLRFGPMKIFHRYGSDTGTSPEPLFSVADMFEPGSFELDTMDNFSTRGLTLFMNAQTSVDGGSVFADMLDAAGILARLLDGEVLDGGRRTLDDAQIAVIRAQFGP